jgi:hypothetical protein
MTNRPPHHTYRVFDRYVESEVPLQLLRQVDSVPAGGSVFRISLQNTVRQPGPEVMWEPGPLGFHMVKEADGFSMVFQGIGWFAKLTDSASHIEVYPMNDDALTFEESTLRSLGDRLVTGLLSRFPQWWGMATVHGALLVKGDHTIALLGRSGAGKSTLSQVLCREFGWTILDDDTFGLFPDSSSVRVWPMGAYPRIRENSLAFFDAEGTTLPGYQGGKMFLSDSADPFPTLLSEGQVLTHIFTLNDLRGEDGGQPDGPSVSRQTHIHAIGLLDDKVMRLNLKREEFTRLSFSAATALAHTPCFEVTYSHAAHPPTTIANSILNNLNPVLYSA